MSSWNITTEELEWQKLEAFERVVKKLQNDLTLQDALATERSLTSDGFFKILKFKVYNENFSKFLKIYERILSRPGYLNLVKTEMINPEHFDECELILRELLWPGERYKEYFDAILAAKGVADKANPFRNVETFLNENIRLSNYAVYCKIMESYGLKKIVGSETSLND